MNRIQSAYGALKLTPWFVVNSRKYITTDSVQSKIDYFIGIIPAWYRFTCLIYKDYRTMRSKFYEEIVDYTPDDIEYKNDSGAIVGLVFGMFIGIFVAIGIAMLIKKFLL